MRMGAASRSSPGGGDSMARRASPRTAPGSRSSRTGAITPALQGIWIIPASDPDGVTQAEAQRVTTIPKGADFDSEPQFSPDGSMIAFTRFKSFEKKKSAIHVVATDGSGLQRLTPWKLNASHPDWSPDGQMIAFDSGDVQVAREQGRPLRHGRRRQRADQAHRQPPTAHRQAHEAGSESRLVPERHDDHVRPLPRPSVRSRVWPAGGQGDRDQRGRLGEARGRRRKAPTPAASSRRYTCA